MPSVLLHDHLDGGLRPQTVLDLAHSGEYANLPAGDEQDLARWFDQSAAGNLENYLRAFDHTVGVMQTPEAIERVAYEAAVDLANDGVVYVESRFSPPQHTLRGMSLVEVVEAVASGFRAGSSGTGLRWGLIIDALRQNQDSVELAELAAQTRYLGVVGFDLAGPEAGYPPELHASACRLARESGLRVTIHAGEAAGRDGVRFIASAMDRCGAERIGHGTELVNDCVVEGDEIVKLGPVATRVRDRRIPIEMCPASNLATSGMTPREHPIGAMYRAGFNVTLSTDNRLMSNTSMSAEFEFVINHHGLDIGDLARITWRSLDASFAAWETKRDVWETILAPYYRAADAEVPERWI